MSRGRGEHAPLGPRKRSAFSAGLSEADPLDHGDSFRAYMHNKNAKLGEQFDADAAAGEKGEMPHLFSGVSIHVNGFTIPSAEELKQLMARHGGRFVLYPDLASITHVICSNLTDRKAHLFLRARKPIPVVHPAWVLESIRAGTLLPVRPFLLDAIRLAPGQQVLTGLVAKEAEESQEALHDDPGTEIQQTQVPADTQTTPRSLSPPASQVSPSQEKGEDQPAFEMPAHLTQKPGPSPPTTPKLLPTFDAARLAEGRRVARELRAA
ncbi:hypothetical protein H632_c1878p1, partial [Helicosporidium sp. ATCC 50920]